jgi:hypothetical protein
MLEYVQKNHPDRKNVKRRQTMGQSRPTIIEVIIKTLVTHTVTYFIMGLLAFYIFDYARLFAETGLNLLMRQTSEPLVMAGPLIIPIGIQLKGLPEVLLQALILSVVLFYWVNHPEKKWLSWVLGIAFFLVMLLPTLGLLVG